MRLGLCSNTRSIPSRPDNCSIPEILENEAQGDMKYLEKCRVKKNVAEYNSYNETSEAEELA
ncbi:MAG: hypothetical protein ABIQ95_00200 [Bdellovibrionia bacterium]